MGCEVETDPTLIELDLGQFEGRLESELRAEDPAGYDAWRESCYLLAAPGGETIHDVASRIAGLIADLDDQKGDILIVWKLDRLARSLKDLVEIVQDLQDRGIGFKSLTESIDTTSSGGRLVFHIFGALAEFERDLIRERTMAGLEAARARGRKGGRKPALSKTDIQKAAAMLLDPKITKTEVAQHFGISRTTLNASLARLKKASVNSSINEQAPQG